MMSISEFVEKHIYVNQTMLISDLLEIHTDWHEKISNGSYTDEEGKTVESDIYEWWIVSDWLLRQLESHGEPILKNFYGTWWGRGTTGQAIANDTVIQEIYRQTCQSENQAT